MSRQPQSATTTLKRKAAIFGVFMVMSAIVVEIALPWADVVGTIGLLVGGLIDNPKIAGMILVVVIGFYAAAKVDDYFSGR